MSCLTLNLHRSNALVLLSVLTAISTFPASSSAMEQAALESQIFMPQMITRVGMNEDQFHSLSDAERSEVANAANRFFLLMKSRAGETNNFKILSDELLSEFSSPSKYLESFFELETVVCSVAITSFAYSRREISFKFYLVFFADGDEQIESGKVILRKVRADYKVSDLSFKNDSAHDNAGVQK